MDLLLLHGALGSQSQLLKIGDKLSETHNIHTLNFSGHGGNPVPDEPFSIKLFADDVLKWLDKTGIAQINIFGYSMGGYAALYLAKHHPDRVNKVFTLAAKFNWNPESAAKEAAVLNPETIKRKLPQFAEELKKRHHPQNWEKILTKTSEMMINLGRERELKDEDISGINNEVMVSVGDRDKMVSIEETASAYMLLKNGKLLVLPGTQHPIEKVSIDRLANEIVTFY